MACLLLAACLAVLAPSSPPLASASAQPASSGAEGAWKPHVAAARRFARSRKGETRFAIVDPRGRLGSFRGGASVEAASVMKVLFLVGYLRLHRDEGLSGSEKRLLGPMIRESNTKAAREIADRLGPGRVERLGRRAGMKHLRLEWPYWGLSRIAANDWARFMYRLDRYLPGRHRAYAERLLARIVARQRWGIAWEAPRGWRLRFKGGWGVGPGKVQNQVALLERGGRRIGLAILTDGGGLSANYKRQTMAGVTKRLLRGLPR